MGLGNKALGGGGGGGTDPQTATNTNDISTNSNDIAALQVTDGSARVFANATDANNFATTAADGILVYVTDEAAMYHVSQMGLVPWFLGAGIDALSLVDNNFVADQILVADGTGAFNMEAKPEVPTLSYFSSFTDTDQTGTSITWSIAGADIKIQDDYVMSGNNIVVPRDGKYEVTVSGGIENNSSSAVNTVFTRIQKVDGTTNGITNEAISSFKTLDVSGSRSGSSVSVSFILDLVAGDAVRVNSAGTASTRITNKIITVKELL